MLKRTVRILFPIFLVHNLLAGGFWIYVVGDKSLIDAKSKYSLNGNSFWGDATFIHAFFLFLYSIIDQARTRSSSLSKVFASDISLMPMSTFYPYTDEFEALFKKWYMSLFYKALDWVEDEEVAKDLVSELFADLWKSYERIRHYKIGPYLFTAIKNKSLNYLRHQKVECANRDAYIRMKEEILSDSELLEQRLQKIQEVIDGQTPLTKFVFEACYYENKTYQEVSEILAVSVSAVHKHISKMMAALRAELLGKDRKRGDG